jgi:hypothetical protein
MSDAKLIGTWQQTTAELLNDLAVALDAHPNASERTLFGYNSDVDPGAEELLASFGGTIDPADFALTTPQTFTVTYNNTTDGGATSGATEVQVLYLATDGTLKVGTIALDGSGSVVSSFSALGMNRAYVSVTGGGNSNVNAINIAYTTSGVQVGQIPAGDSVSQQCLFHIATGKTGRLRLFNMSALKTAVGQHATVVVRAYLYSKTSGVRSLIGRYRLDTEVSNHIDAHFTVPLEIAAETMFYLTATSDQADTEVNCRLSGVEVDSE